MYDLDYQTQCTLTVRHNGARIWLLHDEKTIVVDTWDCFKNMHRRLLLPGDPGYSVHLQRLRDAS